MTDSQTTWSEKEGLAPGTLIHTGERHLDTVSITWTNYSKEQLTIQEITQGDDLPELPASGHTWIHIEGLHEVEVVRKIGERFSLHPLMLEDIVNTGQRPKVEDYDTYLFLVLRLLEIDEETSEISSTQVSFVIGENLVITFTEKHCDPFDAIFRRLKGIRNRFVNIGSGYMGYALIDTLIDRSITVLEILNLNLETLQHEIEETPSDSHPSMVQVYKRIVTKLRRIISPSKEAVVRFQHYSREQFPPELSTYLADLVDHIAYAHDMTESARELASTLQDSYMNSINLRMTKIMGVLTLFSTIFIPLTFLAGIYGMNFQYMPELSWEYSYPVFIGVLTVLGSALGVYFYRKRWF